jgi:ubiquitin carboxyl-terminal hydrolase 5/13
MISVHRLFRQDKRTSRPVSSKFFARIFRYLKVVYIFLDFVPNEEGLAMILSMGFTMRQATKALKATNNNTERAVDYIFSHQDELDMDDEEAPSSSAPAAAAAKNYRDGEGKYRLKAFISHMGTSSQVGHYVCHILKDNQWIIFNDNKVQISQRPPKDLGYLYLYERIKN